ncbi:MAG TPA: hypothetical protein VFH58_12900, partial [Acidimicrobiales bacterium]|nr:hypothetical protein [Acidimicrobiales bacterium]
MQRLIQSAVIAINRNLNCRLARSIAYSGARHPPNAGVHMAAKLIVTPTKGGSRITLVGTSGTE